MMRSDVFHMSTIGCHLVKIGVMHLYLSNNQIGVKIEKCIFAYDEPKKVRMYGF